MFFREHQSSNLSFGWSGGGGATIVLEDLGADAPATVTRAEFGMCAGHGVRSPTSSKVQEAGPSHGLGRGRSSASQPSRLPGVSLAFLGTRALSRLWPSNTFEFQRLGGTRNVLLLKFLVVRLCLFDWAQVPRAHRHTALVCLTGLKYQAKGNTLGT